MFCNILLFTLYLSPVLGFVPSIHEPNYIEFIARLRNARKARNFTQAQLAEKIGELQSHVAKVETCERRLDIIEAAKWCIALGITLNEVLPNSLKAALDNREPLSQPEEDGNG